MLHSIHKILGKTLSATDGEIGSVKDLYFDDASWVVRYVVAETGDWLTERQVLLSPHAFGSLREFDSNLLINISRHQIEHAPSIDTHKTVSRQYEEEYHRYYGWPYYWEGGAIWGMGGVPIMNAPNDGFPVPAAPKTSRADSHLRSTASIRGYHIHASDGEIGHVTDFLMDPRSWVISRLVVKTGYWFLGQEVEIPVFQVDSISYEDSTVYLHMTKEAIEQSHKHQPDAESVLR